MHHSSKVQASAHYDKHRSSRVVSAAMSTADTFAAGYTL